MPDALQVITLLAKLYDEQPEDDPRAEFHRGAAHALRLAAQIIAPPATSGRRRGSGRPSTSSTFHLGVGPGGGKSNGRGPERPHVCEDCGASYALPQHLGLHRKKIHGVPSRREQRQA